MLLRIIEARGLLIVVAAITICSEKAYSYVQPHHVNILHNLPSPEPLSLGYYDATNRCRSRLSAEEVNGKQDTPIRNTSGKTLYEILNSKTDATRSEIKRNYINLVRQTHPDALLSRGEPDFDEENPEFQEIMQAWRTLSNPFERKRYDRQLRAAAFTARVENAAGAIGKTAGPQFLNAFENVAIPFLRRSAATTVAGFTSISEDLANYGSTNTSVEAESVESGIGGIIANAMKSSRKAGKAIDCLELMEKSKELKNRSKKESERSSEMKNELTKVMSKRVNLSLHTPNVKLTSLEALMILDGMNTIDEVNMADVIRFRHTVSYEIEQLQIFESDYEDSRKKNFLLSRDIERKSAALEQAKANANAAVQAEVRARKALEDAINLVAATKQDTEQSRATLQSVNDNLKYNELELVKISSGMIKQQEKVRVALRRKEEAKQDTEVIIGDFKAEKIDDSTEIIQQLLKEERYLRAESARVDAMARRLLSRANKLELKANEMEKSEEQAWQALEEGLIAANKAAESGYGKYNTLKDKNGININK